MDLSLQGKRILVADDSVDFVDMLGLLLHSHGCVVRVAFDGARALEVADEFRPDVALLDLGLPGVDGLEVARRLRADPAQAKVALLAVSGYHDAAHRAQAADAGFDDYLVKPVWADSLLGTIRTALQR